MKKIYLASDSKARKKLLEGAGIKFRVLPSSFKAEIKSGTSYANIVKHNALAKAKDVAAKIKEGIIVAADTICLQDNKIYGKPKNLAQARSMLKKLSSKPQWLYTGIAVIDKNKSGDKIRVACEKTKVYMDKLSDQEISRYFAKTSPLDKAGSFDIQGRGAFFIRRVEGCFYNVIGLPLNKLYRMLKGCGVNILSLIFCVLSLMLCAGCSTEYNVVTGHEETYFYSTDKEVQMGQAISQEAEKEFKLVDDPLVEDRVEKIGKKIAAVCDRKEIKYTFKVIQDDDVNAVSLPGGFVYICSGLVEKVDNDDELAGVIAHEVGHIVARHSIKKLQGMYGYSLLSILTVVAGGSAGSDVKNTADAAFTQLMLGYSREDELLADQLGARYAKLAGYNPQGMVSFLKKLEKIDRRLPLRERNYFKTHPYAPDRIRVVKQELGEKINFNDYINTEQKTHEYNH